LADVEDSPTVIASSSATGNGHAARTAEVDAVVEAALTDPGNGTSDQVSTAALPEPRHEVGGALDVNAVAEEPSTREQPDPPVSSTPDPPDEPTAAAKPAPPAKRTPTAEPVPAATPAPPAPSAPSAGRAPRVRRRTRKGQPSPSQPRSVGPPQAQVAPPPAEPAPEEPAVAASADDAPVAVASATEPAPSAIPTGTGDGPTDDIPPEPEAEAEAEAEADVPEPDADVPEPEAEAEAEADVPEPEPEAEAEADVPEPEPEAEAEADVPEREPEPEATTLEPEADAETPPVEAADAETADAEVADGQEPEAAADTPAVKADFDLPPEVAAVGTLPPEVAPDDAPPLDEEPTRTVDPEALRQRRAVEVRHTLTFLGIFTSVIAVGLVAYTFWLGMWAWPFGSAMAPGCVPGTPTPTAAPVKQTSVRVYNATDRHGLALTVAHDLQKRGFVVPMWDNDPTASAMKSAAEVRYGPDGLLNARTVAAQVKGAAVLVLDANREGPSVDLVLGRTFTALRSSVEADKLIALPTNVPAVCPAANG
jgi:hypothetical protein